MNKQELQNEINKTKEHLAKMEKMLIECENERWKPKKGQKYYYCTKEYQVLYLNWYDTKTDEELYSTYNCFQTREQAEAEAEKILVRRMLEDIARRLNKDNTICWRLTTNQVKFYIFLGAGDELTFTSTYINRAQGTIYCLDENFLDVAISEIGEERLKKYLRGE